MDEKFLPMTNDHCLWRKCI